MDGTGSYSVSHRAGLLPTELTGMWGWILLRSPHLRKGSLPAPAPTKQRPVSDPGTQGGPVALGLCPPSTRGGRRGALRSLGPSNGHCSRDARFDTTHPSA